MDKEDLPCALGPAVEEESRALLAGHRRVGPTAGVAMDCRSGASVIRRSQSSRRPLDGATGRSGECSSRAPGLALSQAKPGRPVPVAPLDELGLAVLDQDLEHDALFHLEPGRRAAPRTVGRVPVLQDDSLAGALADPERPEFGRVVRDRDNRDPVRVEGGAEILQPASAGRPKVRAMTSWPAT